jgi:hypothetical protein
VLRVSVAAEKAGVPSASIVTSSFMPLAGAISKSLGVEAPAIAEYAGVPMIDTDEELRRKVISNLLPQILNALGGEREKITTNQLVAEPSPADIVFRGSLQQVQDHFDDRLWSDGLPVVPPTIQRVEEFLSYTERAPHEVIGICLPEYREATPWNIAVNGVMAGCRPEYMPVLIAVVEAITDPAFYLEDGGVTPGWEPLITISGSIIKDLDFNYKEGVMRVGRKANTSIGRFVRLYMRNVPGQRIPPGTTDKATIGISFNVVLAENEDAATDMHWPTYGMDRGFARGENAVTVQSVVSVSQPVYTGGREARNHVQIMSEAHGPMFAYWAFTGMRHNSWYPLIVMSPSVAQAIAGDGWSKDDVRNYLYEHTKVKAGLAQKFARNAAVNDFDFKDLVDRGVISAKYHESADPERLVPVFFKAEWISIVVAGDPGRNQSRSYMQNHRHGVPVSKRISLPANWHERLRRRKQAN